MSDPTSTAHERARAIEANVLQVIRGKDDAVRLALLALFARGHLLIEDVPGTGKTMLARAIACSCAADFRRLQCTQDLLPSDMTGVSVFDPREQTFSFRQGPVFTDILLADEINRATPRAQSALLECMEERQVSADGETYRLSELFFVVATQNPIELEGTFPLPEAQLDRFLFRLDVRTPSSEAMARILEATTGSGSDHALPQLVGAELAQLQAMVRDVLCGTHLLRHVAELIVATHPENPSSDEATQRFVRYGASARAGQAILLGAKARALLAGRPAVAQEDIDACLLPALRHRVLLGFEADAEQVSVEQMLPRWNEQASSRVG